MYFCAMNLRYIILSFYIITLSCDTCNDFLSTTSGNLTFSSSQHKNCNENPCICSPFCHCNCCGKPVVSIAAIELNTPLPLFAKYISHHSDGLKVSYLHQVWRPPVCSIS